MPRVLTTAGATERGLTRAAVRSRIARGEWSALARGVYLTVPGPPSWLDRAAAVALGTGGVLSHTTAARLHGLDLTPPRDVVHVTLPRATARRQRPGLRLHFHDLAPHELQAHAGIAVTSPLRTVLDCARMLPLPAAVAAIEHAFRLEPVSAVGACRMRRLAQLVELADVRSESALETAVRVLLTLAGLPPTHVQLTVTAGGRHYRLDLAYLPAKLAIEVDRALRARRLTLWSRIALLNDHNLKFGSRRDQLPGVGAGGAPG